VARPDEQAGSFAPTSAQSYNPAGAPKAKNRSRTGPCSSTPFRDRQVAELAYLRAVKRRWRKKMSKYSEYEYRKQPGFDMNAFEGANQAIPMKTLVIHCLDPRADEIPQAVAKYFGDEVYPGDNILDKSGNRVGHTRTLFVETRPCGRI